MVDRTPGWARDAALAFAASAAAIELITHARYGDHRAVVAPADRARYDATAALVQAERRAAVTLIRFAMDAGEWSAVETATQIVSIRRDELGGGAMDPAAALMQHDIRDRLISMDR